MKQYLLIPLIGWLFTFSVSAQIITGTINSATTNQPLKGAGIMLKNSSRRTVSNESGRFNILATNLPDTLVITYAGYSAQHIYVFDVSLPLSIHLNEMQTILQEVTVNTGYYQVAKERATGSFAQISNDQINRSVGTSIIDRLEGITSGLQFDRRLITAENASRQKPELRVRGLATIAGGSAPLIILDNFPYDGDLNSINPNDVESVTILKDAAAASIWGARAGNGVIVINTKQGRFNQPTRISLSSVLNFTGKPDLFYTKNYLPSATTMEIQEALFARNAYPEDDLTYIPGYAELLIKLRDSKISTTDFEAQKALMLQTDFRNEALKHLYQTGKSQQHAFNVNGGGSSYKYYLGGGYDKSIDNVIGNSNSRTVLNFQNTIKLTEEFELSGSIWYSSQQAANNGINYSSIGNGIKEPYTLLTDAEGNNLASGYFGKRLTFLESAKSKGLLDWQYRPLDERRLTDQTSSSAETRINGGLKYSITRNLNVGTTYQYLLGAAEKQSYYDAESYYARNLINRFTQANGSLVIPNGGIMDGTPPSKYESHSGRVQANYTKTAGVHDITVLAGGEISQRYRQQSPGFRQYNYSKELLGGTSLFDYTKFFPVLPLGTAKIEAPVSTTLKSVNRNLSYFSNAAYKYNEKYLLSASARWDGSNLLGVKTNQRGTVLWSAGVAWELHKEVFYNLEDLVSYVRMRITYGSAGLIDKSQSQYPTIGYYTDGKTGFRYASLQHPGNPSLRWEQVNTLNLGIDWRSKSQRLSGSLEWYNKDANHLLGSFMIDPTTGAGSNYKQNYADMRTNGIDFQLNSVNLNGRFRWESDLLLNYTRNKILHYTTPESATVWDYFYSNIKPPAADRSVDAFYAFPWNGLSPETGYPLIYIDGKVSTDYTAYASNYQRENLIQTGVEVPPFYGSLKNTFSFKGFTLSALVTFKTGYVFRRTSMEPGAEYLSGSPDYHTDYYLRWKQPGDEAVTQVPASILSYNTDLASVYRMSEVLSTSGNYIRLQDINMGYSLPAKLTSHLPLRDLRIYAYARNLGIIWKQNKFGIDPEYPNAEFPAPKTIALGIQLTL